MKLKNIDRKVLYEIYTDRDDDERFNVGYIVYNDDTYLLLKSIEPYGNFDGYDLILAEDVYRIAYGTDYLCGIEALANVTCECDYDFGKITMENFAEFAAKLGRAVGVAVYGTGHELQGFVKQVDKNGGLLTVTQLETDGSVDGEFVVEFEDMARISFGGVDQSRTEKLYKALHKDALL